MPKSHAWATGCLRLFFENLAFAGLGDTAGLQPSGAAGSVYVSLHTANPGVGGNQSTNEISYTGYGRVAVARSGAGWTFASGSPDQESNTAAIIFGAMSGGAGGLATYFGVGHDPSGAGILDYVGLITTPPGGLLIATSIVPPEFAAGTLIVTES